MNQNEFQYFKNCNPTYSSNINQSIDQETDEITRGREQRIESSKWRTDIINEGRALTKQRMSENDVRNQMIQGNFLGDFDQYVTQQLEREKERREEEKEMTLNLEQLLLSQKGREKEQFEREREQRSGDDRL